MLTHNQKIAFTSILIEMANVDLNVYARECDVVKHILARIGVDAETFAIAKEVPLVLALKVMSRASDDAKKMLAQNLVDVIDADGKVHQSELHLLSQVCQKLGIDVLFG